MFISILRRKGIFELEETIPWREYTKTLGVSSLCMYVYVCVCVVANATETRHQNGEWIQWAFEEEPSRQFELEARLKWGH